MHQFSNPAILVEGYFVGERWLRLSEIIQDHWPDVDLRWIPTDRRDPGDSSKSYAIVHSPDGKPPYVIMYAGETDDPEQILARLYRGDTSRHDVLKWAEAQDDARKMFEMKKQQDIAAEYREQAAWMVGTKKNIIRYKRKDGSVVTFDRTRPNGGIDA